MPGHAFVTKQNVVQLERKIDEYNEETGPLKEFILPGGSRAAALCHVARAISRRAERDLVTLNAVEPVSGDTLSYLNRLSDLLFASARILNKDAGESDVLWNKDIGG